MAYFNGKLVEGTTTNEYVCFLDIMGIQNKMEKSVIQAGNMIFKLHAAILEVVRICGYESVSIYPIMDGAYITAKSKQDILDLITRVYSILAADFIKEGKKEHQYLCRAAISFGDIIHGRNIPYKASLEFSHRVGYKENILIGEPMILAYKGEKKAAPFGVFIQESAFCLRGDNSIDKNWRWYESKDVDVDIPPIKNLEVKIEEYFEWCAENNQDELKKIEQHRDAAKEYFNIMER